MPRLWRTAQLFRSGFAACSRSYSSVGRRREVPSSFELGQRNSCRFKSPRRTFCKVSSFVDGGGTFEKGIENRVGWKSYAERPRRHLHVSHVSCKELGDEAGIIEQAYETSDVYPDRFVHPGLEIEQEILSQQDQQSWEQPHISLFATERSVKYGDGIVDRQGMVDYSDAESTEQDSGETSERTNLEAQPTPFQPEHLEASNSSGAEINVEQDRTEIVEFLLDGGLEGGLSEIHKPIEIQKGRKYLHVLSVAEVREVLEKARAKDLKVLQVKDACEWTDYIVIASGRSTRHLRGMADAIVYKVKQRSQNVGPNLYPLVEGREAEQWMAVDLGNITIHLFLEEARSYYDLEELWRKKRSHRVES